MAQNINSELSILKGYNFYMINNASSGGRTHTLQFLGLLPLPIGNMEANVRLSGLSSVSEYTMLQKNHIPIFRSL